MGEPIEALFFLTCSEIPKTHSQFLFSETPLGNRKEKYTHQAYRITFKKCYII